MFKKYKNRVVLIPSSQEGFDTLICLEHINAIDFEGPNAKIWFNNSSYKNISYVNREEAIKMWIDLLN